MRKWGKKPAIEGRHQMPKQLTKCGRTLAYYARQLPRIRRLGEPMFECYSNAIDAAMVGIECRRNGRKGKDDCIMQNSYVKWGAASELTHPIEEFAGGWRAD